MRVRVQQCERCRRLVGYREMLYGIPQSVHTRFTEVQHSKEEGGKYGINISPGLPDTWYNPGRFLYPFIVVVVPTLIHRQKNSPWSQSRLHTRQSGKRPHSGKHKAILHVVGDYFIRDRDSHEDSQLPSTQQEEGYIQCKKAETIQLKLTQA